MAENLYARKLKKRIENEVLPGCVIVKNDEQGMQGILDWTIFYGRRWGMLEVKDHLGAPYQPNQEHYIERFGAMSFAAMICPENEEEVLSALQQALAPRRRARVS